MPSNKEETKKASTAFFEILGVKKRSSQLVERLEIAYELAHVDFLLNSNKRRLDKIECMLSGLDAADEAEIQMAVELSLCRDKSAARKLFNFCRFK